MYASSECYFGVNLEPLCDPMDVAYTLLPNMGYFEFIPLEEGIKAGDEEERVESEKVAGLVDVKVGCYYELVVSTFAGNLYNIIIIIRVGDVLQVTGFHNNAPQFKFICRRNVILSIDSDKTNEEDLHKSVTSAKKLLESQNYLLLEYTSYADTSTVPGHYVLFWEIKNIFEEAEPPRPQHLMLSFLKVADCRSGHVENLMDLLISQGSSINQYKAPRCVEPGPALKLLNSKVVGCFFSPKNPTWKI
uniref:Indole-3-acetic acid-amido synthetase GH3.17 n=1 Tax=Ananas comosus var. bracteatus TaxID=296719 RepID=A0A6V7PR26_ANACO|nr:unnamed protein product [Ananas comosus var. bracteatus]